MSRPWNPSPSRLRPRHNSCRPRVSTTSSRMCTPGEVGQGENRPMVQPCLLVCLFWPNGRHGTYFSAFSLNSVVKAMAATECKQYVISPFVIDWMCICARMRRFFSVLLSMLPPSSRKPSSLAPRIWAWDPCPHLLGFPWGMQSPRAQGLAVVPAPWLQSVQS